MAVAADGVTSAGLRTALSGWLDPVAMPRRIRILRALPREETGKLVHERLLELFRDDELPPTRTMEPLEERSSAGGGTDVRVLSFRVPPDSPYFRGHFDGDPILPAVVQLDGLVLRQIERIWPELGAPRQALRLKFKRPVRPGERLELRLALDASRPAVTFGIDGGAGPCASGTLVFGSIASVP